MREGVGLFGLPKSTEFNKRIPKQKFYENIALTPALKRVFIEQINTVYWRNKIAPSTMNIAAGNSVTEIEFFEIKLSTNSLDEAALRQIDKEIPYHIVFLLENEGKYQVWTAYKEASTGNSAFKVTAYYHTEWLSETDLPIQIVGLDLDTVYENFVRQIAGTVLSVTANSTENLKDAVERAEKRKQLQKQIDILHTKIRKEKQLNIQMELNAEIKKIQKELDVL